MPKGTIKRLFPDKGFGFITAEDGRISSSTSPPSEGSSLPRYRKARVWNLTWNEG